MLALDITEKELKKILKVNETRAKNNQKRFMDNLKELVNGF